MRASHAWAAGSQAAPDPADPVWLALFKRLSIFFSKKTYFPFEKP
jgi:hypothetical protein